VTTIGVIGATGYSGAVCAGLALRHPSLRLAFVTSDKAAGEPAAERLGVPGCTLRFAPHDEARKLAASVDVVVLATAAETSAALAPALLAESRALVVDLSGAFRLEAPAYPQRYGFSHPAPSLLDSAHYGLPELFGSPAPGTRLIANPGCYASAALLALAPLFGAGLASTTTDRVVIDGKSGISGAGRRADEAYSFVELAEEVRAYKIGAHQHTPEIARHLARASSSAARRVIFTPHLVPLRRGLVVTAYVDAKSGVKTEDVRAAYATAYEGKPLVRVTSPDRVTVHGVAGSALAAVGGQVDDGVIVAVCALDNLLKGAASQAIQNVNLALGLPETAGLETLLPFAP